MMTKTEIFVNALLAAVSVEYIGKTKPELMKIANDVVATSLTVIAAGENQFINVDGYTARAIDYAMPKVFAEMAKASVVYADENSVRRADPIWKYEFNAADFATLENPEPSYKILTPFEFDKAVHDMTTRNFVVPTAKVENGFVTMNDLGGMVSSSGNGFVYLSGQALSAEAAKYLDIRDIIPDRYRQVVSRPMEDAEVIAWMVSILGSQRQA
jgi:hypothetical protein